MKVKGKATTINGHLVKFDYKKENSMGLYTNVTSGVISLVLVDIPPDTICGLT